MKTENNYLGFLNIRKEKGYTSHDVVAIVRKITRGKTGHTGTLDPDATGVLPICLGRATKLAEYVAAADKSYRAQIVLRKPVIRFVVDYANCYVCAVKQVQRRTQPVGACTVQRDKNIGLYSRYIPEKQQLPPRNNPIFTRKRLKHYLHILAHFFKGKGKRET
jgi:hypothetical protein